MNNHLDIAQDQMVVRGGKTSLKAPSFLIEYAYYAVLCYGMFATALGVSVRLVGAGALAGLAILCLMHFGQTLMVALGPILLALACGISALTIQIGVHQESFASSEVRSLVTWVMSLIIIQTISYRPGFLHRFALVAFLVGCGTFPFLETYVSTEEMTRIGVSHDVGLANPNVFGMWFGFCTVYFLVAGLETRNYMIRIASWSAGLLSLFMVAITVSRAPLLGVAIAAVLAFQKVLKRSFLPVLMVFVVMGLIYVSGLIDTLVGYYVQRGAGESGRSYLWATGFSLFLDAWWGGVGLSNALIVLPSGYETGPHNGLLLIGMASGIFPLTLFVGYLVRAARAAFHARTQKTPYAPYKLSLYFTRLRFSR